MARGRDQAPEVARGEARALEARDVFDVGAGGVFGMDEGVEVPILQLHRGAHAVPAGDLSHLGDDAKSVLDVTLVVVRHLEDEEEFGEVLSHAVMLLCEAAQESIHA